MKVVPSGETLGATIQGLDLSQPLAPEAFDEVVRALGRYSVIRFPEQHLTGRNLKDFSAQFGNPDFPNRFVHQIQFLGVWDTVDAVGLPFFLGDQAPASAVGRHSR